VNISNAPGFGPNTSARAPGTFATRRAAGRAAGRAGTTGAAGAFSSPAAIPTVKSLVSENNFELPFLSNRVPVRRNDAMVDAIDRFRIFIYPAVQHFI
jgi:hypothetical protein